MLKCKATDTDDTTEDPAFGRQGGDREHRALDTKRMDTIDEEFLTAAKDFIERQHKTGTPWFCYFISTRPAKASSIGATMAVYWPCGCAATNLYDLKADPFERAISSIYYADWQVHRVFIQVPEQAIVAKMLESFKEFPPRAKAASFTVSDVMEKIETASPQRY